MSTSVWRGMSSNVGLKLSSMSLYMYFSVEVCIWNRKSFLAEFFFWVKWYFSELLWKEEFSVECYLLKFRPPDESKRGFLDLGWVRVALGMFFRGKEEGEGSKWCIIIMELSSVRGLRDQHKDCLGCVFGALSWGTYSMMVWWQASI